MTLLDAKQAVRLQLDAIAQDQGVAIAHEARDQAHDLPRIEVADGVETSTTITLSGVRRILAKMTITIVTPWGDGTAGASALYTAIMAAFPANSFWGGGRMQTPPTATGATRDGAERRLPLTLELDVFD